MTEACLGNANQLAQPAAQGGLVVVGLYALMGIVAHWEVVCPGAEALHATLNVVQGIGMLMVIAPLRESFALMALIMTEIC